MGLFLPVGGENERGNKEDARGQKSDPELYNGHCLILIAYVKPRV